MIRKLIILLSIIFTFFPILAQRENNTVWTNGTAFIVPKNNLYVNSTYYSLFGLTNKIELQSKPLLWVKIPNFGAKVNWYNFVNRYNSRLFANSTLAFSSRHFIYYPTPLLKTLYKLNILDFALLNSNIHSLIVLKNEILISFKKYKNKSCYWKYYIVTFNIGMLNSIYKKDIFYQNLFSNVTFKNTSFLSKNNSYFTGIDFDSWLTNGISYKIKTSLIVVQFKKFEYVAELGMYGYFHFLRQNKLRITFGYEIYYSNVKNFSIIPLLGISYRINFNNSKTDSHNLFDKNVLPKTNSNNLP